ncbi:MAG: TIGR03084 family metal-binding protein [Actinobacteria bacterium]|nr:TIGR03084 family metal-binding protein [Actinomycetota bacterium]
MAVDLQELLADLQAETADLESRLEPLTDDIWEWPTPAAGWRIRDQISHLAYFDEAAVLAATDSARFLLEAEELMELGYGFPDLVARRYSKMAPCDLLNWFKSSRRQLLEVFADMDPKTRLAWYGPQMSAASSVTARLMETWAHGQDVVDALGLEREATNRLRHIAHLGVSTFGFAFEAHSRAVPVAQVRVELTAPQGGGLWTWGPAQSDDRVIGRAEEFCLVVTQRRHVLDTELEVIGPVATEWMSIAQAFAGPAGPGRKPDRPTG